MISWVMTSKDVRYANVYLSVARGLELYFQNYSMCFVYSFDSSQQQENLISHFGNPVLYPPYRE